MEIQNERAGIAKLAEALAKAQAEMHGAVKDGNNPHFRSKYATLEAVWDACREPLTKHGLAVIQTFDANDQGEYLLTTLTHASGQYVTSRLKLYITKKDSQGLGSAITYARRYALAALVGVIQVDDDGNEAVDHEPRKQEYPASRSFVGSTGRGEDRGPTQSDSPVRVLRPNDQKGPSRTESAQAKSWSPTPAQLTRLFAIASANGWSNEHVKEQLHDRYGHESSKDLTREQYDDFCKFIEQNPNPL